jgi:hypothetical protein
MKIKMVGFPAPVSKLYHHWDEGLAKLGDKYIHCDNLLDPEVAAADCFYQTNEIKPKFFTGPRAETHGNVMQYIIDSQKPYIVSESAPFRKHPEFMRFGWWSYKWDLGNFNNDNVDNRRWQRFERLTGTKFKAWSKHGDDIVIMGQKEGDSSLKRLYAAGYKSFYFWVADIVEEIRKYSDRRIIIRPHPRNLLRGIKYSQKALGMLHLKGVDTSDVIVSTNLTQGGNQGGEGLANDLKQAHCVVTYNSLSSVEAVEEGVPVFALDGGSMAHPVAHHDLSQIENLRYDIDLTEWKNKIAYTMWNKEDVSSGECWAHLKGAYFK